MTNIEGSHMLYDLICFDEELLEYLSSLSPDSFDIGYDNKKKLHRLRCSPDDYLKARMELEELCHNYPKGTFIGMSTDKKNKGILLITGGLADILGVTISPKYSN